MQEVIVLNDNFFNQKFTYTLLLLRHVVQMQIYFEFLTCSAYMYTNFH